MKTVYRVEHIAYRHGPYVSENMNLRCEALASKLCLEAGEIGQPLPKYDGITEVPEGFHCGFDSLDSLFDWFGRWLDDLEEHDYHVAVFNVDAENVIVGHRQVIFPRKRYRRATAIPMGKVKR